MSQAGNSVSGDAFLPGSPPVPPVNPSENRPPDVTGDYLKISLPPEEVAKIEAFRKRSEGHPRVSEKSFKELRDRLVKELPEGQK